MNNFSNKTRFKFALGAGLVLATACASAQPMGGPSPVGDPSHNPDMTEFAKEVDANGDGRMSLAEWQAKGLPESSFKMFEKGRGYVTLFDYKQNAAPAGIDQNGDGKLTVSEFKEFDRQMSARMSQAPQK